MGLEVFDNLLRKIITDELFDFSLLLPYLKMESKKDRIFVNTNLAIAYMQKQDYDQAKVFINRAWLLSGFADELLNLYIKIHFQTNDYNEIREAYKRIGMRKAKENKIQEALFYFQQSHMAMALLTKTDNYEYDFDILDSIERLAKPHQYMKYPWITSSKKEKMRIAYLVYGMLQTNSAIIRVINNIVQYHDQSNFEVVIFSPDTKEQIEASQDGKQHMEIFEKSGVRVVLVERNSATMDEHLRSVAAQIYSFQPDILVFSTLLAELNHYYIASLRPAPIMLGQVSGPLPQFAAPLLDATISWCLGECIETPCDNYVVVAEVEKVLPSQTYHRSQLNLTNDAVVMIMAGRHTKFQDAKIWQAIFEVLRLNDKAYLIVVGIQGNEPKFLQDMITADIQHRLLFFPYRKDYFSIMGVADIFIDTYPSGGGQLLFDAMSLKMPIVSFEHDYSKPFFHAASRSVMGEYAASGNLKPELLPLVAKRDDFAQFKEIVNKLILDETYRKQCGEMTFQCFQAVFNNPQRMTRNCEKVYVDLFNRKIGNFT
ncbi:hypothetical protein SOV_47390 [Sporomusa ovata DSM 2662]|uniref:COG3914: Predicted O-linked N-acetylglucosamine transferase, SPINDLY family n=1 Tax=Sporomusa ovata TaxID=2378 RepID=A0A0U1KUW5_9FIRM|nr:O-linked N-acetylglucosamine transferase [Sporomusa ovata]EQB27120.1 O-linked N-acetylglucosamine transferase [Sporomusa ovata DSM 2662]CQR71222.1 COG3914: Predicted O-linked N-acetylglucosamine transferase, SPINDLY family [Sporomusa ovata]